jgi:hypothetical protein
MFRRLPVPPASLAVPLSLVLNATASDVYFRHLPRKGRGAIYVFMHSVCYFDPISTKLDVSTH